MALYCNSRTNAVRRFRRVVGRIEADAVTAFNTEVNEMNSVNQINLLFRNGFGLSWLVLGVALMGLARQGTTVVAQPNLAITESGSDAFFATEEGMLAEVKLPANWFEGDAPPPVFPPPVPPPTRDFNKAGINEITFDDVSFDIVPGEAFDRARLTENIRRLDGLKIRVRGFIRPSFKQTGIQKFVFVRDNQECCFGPGAAIYDCILVELGKNKSTTFSVRPVTLVGTFYLEEYSGPDGNIWAIFRMRDGTVE